MGINQVAGPVDILGVAADMKMRCPRRERSPAIAVRYTVFIGDHGIREVEEQAGVGTGRKLREKVGLGPRARLNRRKILQIKRDSYELLPEGHPATGSFELLVVIHLEHERHRA